MVQIIPAVLATSEQQYQEDINKIASSESLKEGWVHIDFADNIFVQNKTIEPEVINKFPTNLRKEAHLMVKHPSSPWIYELEKADFSRVIIHLESDTEDWISSNLAYLGDQGIETGLAINPETKLEKALRFENDIDLLMILGVKPGLQGQQFLPETLNRVKEAVRLFKNPTGSKIAVDGGVSNKNAKLLADAGADILIVGSYLLTGDIGENLENLWEVING